jgi:hypothetical protein
VDTLADDHADMGLIKLRPRVEWNPFSGRQSLARLRIHTASHLEADMQSLQGTAASHDVPIQFDIGSFTSTSKAEVMVRGFASQQLRNLSYFSLAPSPVYSITIDSIPSKASSPTRSMASRRSHPSRASHCAFSNLPILSAELLLQREDAAHQRQRFAVAFFSCEHSEPLTALQRPSDLR